MGRALKIKYSSSRKPVKKVVLEKKVIYDHIYKVKNNPQIINEFKKNMEIPSELFHDDEVLYKSQETYNHDIFLDKGYCCQAQNKCVCYDPNTHL